VFNIKILDDGLTNYLFTSTTKSVSFSLKALMSSIKESRALN
jgi:hypothetical protein